MQTHYSLLLNSAQEKIFSSLNPEIKDLFIYKLFPLDTKIAQTSLELLSFCQSSETHQKLLVSLLNQASRETGDILDKILRIARKGLLEKFFHFAKSKKREPHSPIVMQEIVQLFYFAVSLNAHSFSSLILPPFDTGGKEVILKFKASHLTPAPEILPYKTLSVLMKKKLLDTHSSFQEKQAAVLNCLKIFSDPQRLSLETYLYFFESLQNDYHLKFGNEEKVQLIKLIFDFTTDIAQPIPRQYAKEDIDEFLHNAWQLKECYGPDGFLLFCSPLNLTVEASFEDLIHMLRLLVVCENSLDVIDLLEKFSNLVFSFNKLLEMLETAFGQLGFDDSHFNEDIKLKLERFLNDPDVKFPLSRERLDQMHEWYQQIQQFCKEYQYFTLNELVNRGDAIHQKAIKYPLEIQEVWQLIAIGRMALYKKFEIYPDRTQVLTVLGLLIDGKNYLSQVMTGEGKSIIVTLIAFIIAMQNRAVDIITSDRYLAMRDHDRFKSLFKRFGIRTSHICRDEQTPADFRGQILYGTVTDFEFAFMRDQMNAVGFFKERSQYTSHNFDCAIVDEVDNLLIDTATNSARLAYPSEESYHWIYAPILKFAKMNSKLALSQSMVSILREFIKKNVDSINGELVKKTSNEKLEMWFKSACIALFQKQENIDYVVRKTQKKDGKLSNSIQIVDAQNTGRIMEGSRWSEGIHEFIEVKHDINVEKESLVPISLSHASFYRFYRLILGLSGTLGSRYEREEIHQIYSIHSFDVPPHFPSQRKDLPPKILASDHAYFQEILQSISACKLQGRPILVICKTIQETEKMADFLKENKINCQLLNEMQEEKDTVIISRAGFPGTVTVATNTASRGTDIQLSKISLANGGLHVILTFYPESQRVYYQIIGRSGRRGQPGSSEMILSRERGMLKTFRALSLSEEELMNHLEKKRQENAFDMQQLRIKRSEYENITHLYLQRFFENFKNWIQNINQESFLDHHSIRLSKLRLSKSQNIDVDDLCSDEKTIVEECLALLQAPKQEKMDPLKWRTLLCLIIERLKTKVLTNWSVHFYQEAQVQIFSSLVQTPIDYENAIEKNFNSQKETWEKYMQASGQGIFILINELIKINLIEKPKI